MNHQAQTFELSAPAPTIAQPACPAIPLAASSQTCAEPPLPPPDFLSQLHSPLPAPNSALPPFRAPPNPLPSVDPWPEPVQGQALLTELVHTIQRFVVMPKWGAEAAALWIVHTYAFHLRDVATYLGLESPERRCGKTTLMTLLSKLAHRTVVSSNLSSPAFFHAIQEKQPTLLIDETDTFLNGNVELRGILNAGYTKDTAFVMRVAPPSPTDGQPVSRLETFSCWCPKAIATIGRLPDTLEDRCIVLRMQRKATSETCARLRTLVPTPLRRQCARFVLDHQVAIAAAQPTLPPDLNDRAADIWEPLFTLADLAGGDWPALARQAAIALTASAEESNPIGSLLLDIFICFIQEHTERLFSRTLVAWLNSLTDRPWAEPRKGKPITELWLAQQLRPYGIRPKTLWIGPAQAKGYLQEDFRETFRRYIPKSEIEALKAELSQAAPATPPAPLPPAA